MVAETERIRVEIPKNQEMQTHFLSVRILLYIHQVVTEARSHNQVEKYLSTIQNNLNAIENFDVFKKLKSDMKENSSTSAKINLDLSKKLEGMENYNKNARDIILEDLSGLLNLLIDKLDRYRTPTKVGKGGEVPALDRQIEVIGNIVASTNGLITEIIGSVR